MTALTRHRGRLLRAVTSMIAPLRTRLQGQDPERGDVPGWVLITIMTAGLVTALWLIAGDLLVEMFVNALEAVTGP